MNIFRKARLRRVAVQESFNIFAHEFDRRERFFLILEDHLKKYKHIPDRYKYDLMQWRKEKRPWRKDRKVVNRLMQAARAAVRGK